MTRSGAGFSFVFLQFRQTILTFFQKCWHFPIEIFCLFFANTNELPFFQIFVSLLVTLVKMWTTGYYIQMTNNEIYKLKTVNCFFCGDIVTCKSYTFRKICDDDYTQQNQEWKYHWAYKGFRKERKQNVMT